MASTSVMTNIPRSENCHEGRAGSEGRGGGSGSSGARDGAEVKESLTIERTSREIGWPTNVTAISRSDRR